MGTKYYYEDYLYDNYLQKEKIIKARSSWELEIKRNEILQKWEVERAKKEQKELIEDAVIQAEIDTEDAQNLIEDYQNILHHTLNVDDKLSWDTQKRNESFDPFMFSGEEVIAPDYEKIKIKYSVNSLKFYHKFPVFKQMFEVKLKKAEDEYAKALDLYNDYNIDYKEQKEEYEIKKSEFENAKLQHNLEINSWRDSYENGESDAIERYIRVVLENSHYPDGIEKEFEVQMNCETKILIISYKVPNPSSVPQIIEYKYIKTRKETTIKTMKKSDYEKFYDDTIFQIALRTMHEVFESDYSNNIESVVFNGWTEYIDEATGLDTSSCIISVQANKDEFLKIQLDRIDFKKCIQSLKGLFAGKIINLAPVRPLVNINTEDKRFVESKAILSELYSGTNLASMHWEDFEHLVRELFERMFQESGGEVKVTQASSDGGVDAIAFDPDPIRGGKFVIQAKRYNMTVPVSAVRDLYGTMLHEGATKGILVTTSSFGRDSYEFIKDKPVTLLNGQELLHMFNKHGYNDLTIVLAKK